MYSTKKSFAFNPEKTAQEISRILNPEEKIIGIFLQGATKFCIFTNSRIAIIKVASRELEMSIPLRDVKNLVQNNSKGINLSYLKMNKENPYLNLNPLKNPLTNPLKSPILNPLKSDHSFAVHLTNDEMLPIGDFAKTDWDHIDAAFREAISSKIDSDNIVLDTKATREAEFASIDCNISWNKVPNHLQKNIQSNISEEEKPLFIIATAGTMAGAIVALPNRCLLIKSGAIAGFMAGSLGGARVASFYYRDITGIEYNSGLLTGVVEILTPSYEGGTNKDYWRGTFKSRNSDSNDPWTLNNTLPMPKLDYAQAKVQFDKLRAIIGENKNSSSITNIIQSDSVADEIEKLSKLLERNLIDEDEYKEAKRKLLGK